MWPTLPLGIQECVVERMDAASRRELRAASRGALALATRGEDAEYERVHPLLLEPATFVLTSTRCGECGGFDDVGATYDYAGLVAALAHALRHSRAVLGAEDTIEYYSDEECTRYRAFCRHVFEVRYLSPPPESTITGFRFEVVSSLLVGRDGPVFHSAIKACLVCPEKELYFNFFLCRNRDDFLYIFDHDNDVGPRLLATMLHAWHLVLPKKRSINAELNGGPYGRPLAPPESHARVLDHFYARYGHLLGDGSPPVPAGAPAGRVATL